MEFTPYEIRKFKGGWTDEYMSGNFAQYWRMDNIVMNEEGDMLSRDGSVIYDSANPRPNGDVRANGLYNFNENDKLLATSAKKCFYYSSGWSEITGPNSNSVFSAGDSSSNTIGESVKDHLYLANDSGSSIMKIFKDSTGAMKVLNAGLPRFPDARDTATLDAFLPDAVDFANDIRTAMAAHFDDSGVGNNHNADHVFSFAAACSDLPTLITLTRNLIEGYEEHIADARLPSGWAYHNKTNWNQSFGHFVFGEYVPPEDVIDCVVLLRKLWDYYFLHITSYNASAPTNTTWSAAGSHPGTIHFVGGGGPPLDLPSSVTSAGIPGGLAGNTLTGYGLLGAVLDDMNEALNAHYADNGGAGGHTTPNTNDQCLDTASPTVPVIMLWCYYRGFHGYLSHRNRNAPVHAETEPSDSLLAAAHLARLGMSGTGTYTIAQHPLTPLDMESSTDLNTIAADILAAGASGLNVGTGPIEEHIKEGGATAGSNDRHLAAGGSLGDYSPFSGTANLGTILLGSFNNYLYAFHYNNKYTTDADVTYEDFGAPYIYNPGPLISGYLDLVTTTNYDFEVDFSSLDALPTTQNYPTTTGTIKIFRTTPDGTVFYQVGEIASGTTTFVDTAHDVALPDYQTLYTTGGLLAHDEPPVAKFLVHVNEKMYYGNLTYSHGSYSNYVVESLAGAPGAVPEANFCELPAAVTGLSEVNDFVIAFTSHGTFRLEGTFDEFGKGSIKPVSISNQFGLVAGYSPIRIDGGVIFFSHSGIHITDGYKISLLSKGWLKTYLTMTSSDTKKSRICGTVDLRNERVWWGLQLTSGATDNDGALILDLRQGFSPSACFQTASNSSYFGVTAVTYFNNQIIRGDKNGYIFKHDPSYTTDPKVVNGASATTWTKRWIRYDFRTTSYDFGTLRYRKWVPSMSLKFKNLGNLSAQINGINDDGKSFHSLTPIRWRGKPSFGDPTDVVFDNAPGFTYYGMIEAKRRFPSGSLRCSNKMLQLTLAKVILYASDDYAQATVNPTANTATLLSGSWPADLEDQVITFADDSYDTEFTIVSVSGAVLTYQNAAGEPSAGNYKWEIKGYPKDEKMHCLSMIVRAAPLGEEQPNPVNETGGNE